MNLFKSLKLMMIVVVVLLTLLLPGQRRAAEDLTGTWFADDGGAYYIRQVGNSLWWNGMSENGQGSSFANVFRGTIKGDTIIGDWADVPRGQTLNSGALILRIVNISPDQIEMRKQRETGGFSGSVWSKAKPPKQAGPLSGTRQRKVQPDGTVEIHNPDGTIVLLNDGRRTIISPEGHESHTISPSVEAQVDTQPSLPNDNRITDWLEKHNNYLLGIIRTLVGNDQGSVDNYLRNEGADSSVYQRINKRAKTIGRLTP